MTDDSNMDLKTLIWRNSFYNWNKCEYKSKSRKGLKIHRSKVHDNDIQNQPNPGEMLEENSSNNCETLKCDLCEIEDFSEIRLKIHKAK